MRIPLLLAAAAAAVAAAQLDDCNSALGMETGRIKDTQLSASSSFDALSVGPTHARIRGELDGGAWCPSGQTTPTSSEWLEVDLGAPTRIVAVETQGRFGGGHGKEYPPAYKLHYWRQGLDGWVAYADHNGSQLVEGNSNTFTPVLRELGSPVIASKVRIVPFSEFQRTVCLRLELYGCPYQDALSSYSVATSGDWAYDGRRGGDGNLSGGRGLLADGVAPDAGFHARPEQWLSFPAASSPAVVDVALSSPQRLSAVRVFVGADAFSTARLYFSRRAGVFPKAAQEFHYRPLEGKRDGPSWVRIPTGGRRAQFLRIQLSFQADWLLLGEIAVDSKPLSAADNSTEAEAGMPIALVFPEDVPEMSRETITLFTLDDMPVAYLGLILGVTAVVVIISALVISLVYMRQRKIAAENYSAVYAGLATLARSGNEALVRSLEGRKSEQLRLAVNPGASSSFLARVNNMENSLRDHLPREKAVPFSAPSPPNRPLPTSPPPAYASEEDSSEYAEAETPLLPQLHSTADISRISEDASTMHYASSDISSVALHKHLLHSVQGTLSRSKYSSVEIGGGAASAVIPEIPRHRLSFLAKLGEGQFGEVHRAQLQTPEGRVDVAVKSLRHSTDPQLREDFEKELRVLSRLSHPNVVGLVGRSGGGLMIFEFVAGGDLHAFMRGSKEPVGTRGLLSLGSQAAGGMAYLSGLGFVHRDLAARNCLVSADGATLKIADFGMARALYASQYYRIEGNFVLPIRWMAPEALLLGKFTCATDVWSLGVLLWELWGQCAAQPFAHLDDAAVVDNLQACYYHGQLKETLMRPSSCSREVWDLMLACWGRGPEARPQFPDIHTFLRARIGAQRQA